MGNKGSKGAGAENGAPSSHDKPLRPGNELSTQGSMTQAMTGNSATSPTHIAFGNPQQPSTGASSDNAGTQKQIDVGLAEFGHTENISAQESYNHWDKKTGSDTENVGAGVVRNKELEKTMRHTMRNTMCNGDLRQLVKLPPNADMNEWIALNTIHFYRTCSQIGETYRDLCTPQSCSLMSAGNVEYLWKDDHDYTKPARVPACMYMEFALREAYLTIEDPNVFPNDEAQPFPRHFLPKVKEIFKRLFRQFAHLYYSHYDQVKQSGSSKHLNSTFKHFIYFVLEFALIDQQTLSPLQKFIDHIVHQNPPAQ